MTLPYKKTRQTELTDEHEITDFSIDFLIFASKLNNLEQGTFGDTPSK